MSPIALELDRHLQRLDPETARLVERLVRTVMELSGAKAGDESGSEPLPAGYFERTAGALAGEPFDPPPDPPIT